VKLPIEFTYQWDPGSDTFEGHFTSHDGKVVIHNIKDAAPISVIARSFRLLAEVMPGPSVKPTEGGKDAISWVSNRPSTTLDDASGDKRLRFSINRLRSAATFCSLTA